MVYFLVVLAALSRLLPHPANFAPIGALGLFYTFTLFGLYALAQNIAAQRRAAQNV